MSRRPLPSGRAHPAWPAVLAALVLVGCRGEPVDRFCSAVHRASTASSWRQSDDQEALVAEAWRGDPVAPVEEFVGLRAWHRAGALDELCEAGSRRERRCEVARAWLAEQSWRRFGLVVAVEGDLLVVIGPAGSPEEPEGWPPPDIDAGVHQPLLETVHRVAPDGGSRASLHLPDQDELTFEHALLLSSTLVQAGFDPPEVYYADRSTAVRIGPPRAPPAVRSGPTAGVGATGIELELRVEEGRAETRAFLRVDGLGVDGEVRSDRPGAEADSRSLPDPWAAAWAAAAWRAPLTPGGECLMVSDPAAVHAGSLTAAIGAGLARFETDGLPGVVLAPRGAPLEAVIEAMTGLAALGLEPVRVAPVEGADWRCEAGITDEAELQRELERRRLRVQELSPR